MKQRQLINRKDKLFLSSWIIFLLLLVCFLLRGVLFHGGLYARDYVFPFSGDYATSTWDYSASSPNLEVNKIPLNYILRFGSHIFGPENFINFFQATTLFLVPFVISLLIFFTLKKTKVPFWKTIVITTLPSLFYLLNPWVLERISNHLFMVLAMAFNPLLFFLFYKMLNKPSLSKIILTASVAAFISILSSHNVFYILPLLFFFTLVVFLLDRNKKRIIFTASIFSLFYFLLSAFWIAPLVIRSASATLQPSYKFGIESIEKLSQLNTTENVFQLIGGGAWRPLIGAGRITNILSINAYILTVACLLSLVLFRKSNTLLIVSICLLFILLFSFGTNAPIPIYQWLVNSRVHGYLWIYRDPSRFIQYLILIFTTLLTFSLYGILVLKKLSSSALIRTLVVTLIFLALFTSPAAINFYNHGGRTLVASKLPNEYQDVIKYLQEDSDSPKTIWLPLKEYYYYDWNKVPDVTGDFYSISSPTPTFNLSTSAGTRASIYRYLYQKILLDVRTEEIGNLLAPLNVKYVVVHSDLTTWQKYEATKLNDILSIQKDLVLAKKVGPYNIYRNSKYQNSKVFTVKSGTLDNMSISSMTKIA